MIGLATPPAQAAPLLVPWVLLAMAIPLWVARLGHPRGAAALVWQAAGLEQPKVRGGVCELRVVVLLSLLRPLAATPQPLRAFGRPGNAYYRADGP